jgi:hypothetical protein
VLSLVDGPTSVGPTEERAVTPRLLAMRSNDLVTSFDHDAAALTG